jgi:hypothetical protein
MACFRYFSGIRHRPPFLDGGLCKPHGGLDNQDQQSMSSTKQAQKGKHSIHQ